VSAIIMVVIQTVATIKYELSDVFRGMVTYDGT
jgi:hypothetical protein